MFTKFVAVKAIRALLAKELLLELRRRHALAGLLVYVLATVFVAYLSINSISAPQTWAALVWITGLFTAFNAMQKAFLADSHGQDLYLYSLASPRAVIISKSIYNALLVAALNVLSLLFFLLFFGSEVLSQCDWTQLLLGLLLGSTGLGLSLTFVSALAFKSNAGTGLVAILGFPIIIPLIITMVRFTQMALEGAALSTNSYHLLVLVVLNVVSLVLSLVLFPYLWRE